MILYVDVGLDTFEEYQTSMGIRKESKVKCFVLMNVKMIALSLVLKNIDSNIWIIKGINDWE